MISKNVKQTKYKFIKSRRGQTQDTQLNWIFILIVGALILSFFTYVVIKQKSASDAKFAGKSAQLLNTILVGAKVSSGTVQDIDTPDLEIRFSCNDYYIGPASRRLGNRVLFSPEFVEGDNLITWTLDWNMPFKAATFLYLTTPRNKYVVVGDSTEADEIFENLPDKLYKEQVSNAMDVEDDGDPFVRFIFVDPVGVHFPIPNLDAKVTGLIIYTGDNEVHFLKDSDGVLRTTGVRHYYISDEILFGAIFADDDEIYSCLVDRAYERLGLVADIYFEKFNLLSNSYLGNSCYQLYKNNPNFKSIRDSAADQSNTAILSAKSQLKSQNDKAQLWSCPLLY